MYYESYCNLAELGLVMGVISTTLPQSQAEQQALVLEWPRSAMST